MTYVFAPVPELVPLLDVGGVPRVLRIAVWFERMEKFRLAEMTEQLRHWLDAIGGFGFQKKAVTTKVNVMIAQYNELVSGMVRVEGGGGRLLCHPMVDIMRDLWTLWGHWKRWPAAAQRMIQEEKSFLDHEALYAAVLEHVAHVEASSGGGGGRGRGWWWNGTGRGGRGQWGSPPAGGRNAWTGWQGGGRSGPGWGRGGAGGGGRGFRGGSSLPRGRSPGKPPSG
jgi:hypothetical protein